LAALLLTPEGPYKQLGHNTPGSAFLTGTLQTYDAVSLFGYVDIPILKASFLMLLAGRLAEHVLQGLQLRKLARELVAFGLVGGVGDVFLGVLDFGA